MARQRTRAGRRPNDRDDGRTPRIRGDGRTARIHRDDRGTRIHGDGRNRRIHREGGTRIHGDGRNRRIHREGSTRIHGDGRTTRIHGAGRGTPARGVPRPGDGRTSRSAGPTRRGRTGGAATHRLRTSLRLVASTFRRFTRAAGHASTASVATADARAHPVAVRPARAADRRRYPVRRSPGIPVLVVATVMVLILAMLGVERVTGISVLPDQLFAGLQPPPRKFPVLSASAPTEISIGKVGLRAPVHHVGLAADGTIAVPELSKAGEAGWYDRGPTPGQYGPAVIVGHVDTTTGPAVFHDLKKLDDGDRVEVTRQDHSVAVFEITSVQRYGKEKLPVDEIFGDFSRPNLRLITCGGRWVGGETGYADNLVVYASLVTARGG